MLIDGELVNMCAVWFPESGEAELPDGYEMVMVAQLSPYVIGPEVGICAPRAFIEKADPGAVLELAAQTLRNELHSMVKSGGLKWQRWPS